MISFINYLNNRTTRFEEIFVTPDPIFKSQHLNISTKCHLSQTVGMIVVLIVSYFLEMLIKTIQLFHFPKENLTLCISKSMKKSCFYLAPFQSKYIFSKPSHSFLDETNYHLPLVHTTSLVSHKDYSIGPIPRHSFTKE